MTITLNNETLQSIFEAFKIPSSYTSASLERLTAADSRYLKDLKLNLSATVLKSATLSLKEAYLLALAVAINEKSTVLIEGLTQLAAEEGATEPEIAEVFAMTSLMNSNNVFYRFRHYLPGNAYYNNTPAGFRMSIMMNPVLGKELFELASLVVSALNGCEMCVTSHEASVKHQGASEARIYDAIRLAATVKSFTALL